MVFPACGTAQGEAMTTEIVELICKSSKLRKKIRAAANRAGMPLTAQAISGWRNLKNGVPPSRAQVVASVLKLPLHEVRPDIFPRRIKRSA